MLRPYETDFTHTTYGYMAGNLGAVFGPQLASFKRRGKLTGQGTPPSGGRPRRLSNRAIDDLAPLLSADDKWAAANRRAIGPEHRGRRRRVHRPD